MCVRRPTDDSERVLPQQAMKHDFSELKLDGVTRRFAGSAGKAFNALTGMTLTIRRGPSRP